MFSEVAEAPKTDINAAHVTETGSFDPDSRVERGAVSDVSPSNTFDPDSRVERPTGQGDRLEQMTVQDTESGSYKGAPLDGTNATETKAEKVYTDDSGKIYRVGDDLLADNEYTINRYHYMTDSLGRIQNVEGPLRLKNHEGKLQTKDTLETVGKGFQKALDELGHLIADLFDGGNGLENIVAMNRWVNRSQFKKVECRLAKALNEGHEVYYKVEPVYSGESRRPSGFYVTDTVDGEVTETYIRNEAKNKDA